MAKKTTKKSARKSARKAAPVEAPPPDADLAPAPITLGEVVGQAKPVSVLSRAFASGRLHHAWIFHGQRGVGKRTTALAFAAALLDPTTTLDGAGIPTPDPGSPVARRLASGAHPDLHLITKELARYSDQKTVRDAKLTTIPKDVIDTRLIQKIPLAPSVTDHGIASRVFIVDEAELLDRSPTNAPVQNALLKTLEEPPAGAVLILVTESEDRLLPTIRSRCQRVAFGTLTPSDLAAWAEGSGGRGGSEGSGGLGERWSALEPGARRVLIDFAEGSPGRLAEGVGASLHEWHAAMSPLVDRAIEGQLPVALGKTMSDLVGSFAEAQVARDKRASKTAASSRGMELAVRVIVRSLQRKLRSAASEPHAAERLAVAIESVNAAARLQASSTATTFVCDAIGAALQNGPANAPRAW